MAGAVLRVVGAGVVVAVGTAAVAEAATPVRPGMSIHIELPGHMNPDPEAPRDQPFYNSCTLAFLYEATVPVADQRRKPKKKIEYEIRQYASTAGHCVFTDTTTTELTFGPEEGPTVSLTTRSAAGPAAPGARIGRFVYAGETTPVLYPNPDMPEHMDLGIIELDPGVITNPAMCHFGGPTGMREEPLASPEPLHLYGTGENTGFNRQTGTTLLPGRTGVGSSALHPNLVSGSFALSGYDSGSPIIDGAGRAVALVKGVGLQSRVAVSLARAEQVLGLDFKLRTAPLATGAAPFGIDPGCVPAKSGG